MIFDAPLIGTGLGSFAQNLGNEGYATWIINNTPPWVNGTPITNLSQGIYYLE